MNIRSRILLTAAAALPIAALAIGGGKSGLPSGSRVLAFEPTHVTGPDAGTNTCPVCKYGPRPAVQVWINQDNSENVAKIADTLEHAIAKQGPYKLKAFLVFIKPAAESKAAIEKNLKGIAEKEHLQNVALTYVDGPAADSIQEYRINTDSTIKNTVLVYHNRTVDANFVNLKANNEGLSSLKSAVLKACNG